MTLHREGRKILPLFFVILAVLVWTAYVWWPAGWWVIALAALVFYGLVVQFFRHPKRPLPAGGDHLVYAPADGQVVVIETTEEDEYFHDQRIQISIFMSPLNVHANRHPISGEIAYYKYHPGKYLVAWHPKSSTENERSTLVYRGKKVELLVRQIAGAMARRIKTYARQGEQVEQGGELGFITFGSRVDVFLPPDAQLKVKIGDEVKANVNVLAEV
ncbi:MAG: phosphatidylserine decarboxylase family protein [Lewinella sp.]|nr:phosphatidylserine decarboxylase family protein [Lewinella sp.]